MFHAQPLQRLGFRLSLKTGPRRPFLLPLEVLSYFQWKSYPTSNGSPILPPMEVLSYFHWKSYPTSNGGPVLLPIVVFYDFQ